MLPGHPLPHGKSVRVARSGGSPASLRQCAGRDSRPPAGMRTAPCHGSGWPRLHTTGARHAIRAFWRASAAMIGRDRLVIGKTRSILPAQVLACGEPVAGAGTVVGNVTPRGAALGRQGIAATPVKAARAEPELTTLAPGGETRLARPTVAAAGFWRRPWHAGRHRSRSRRRLRRHEADDRHEKRPAFDRGGGAVVAVAFRWALSAQLRSPSQPAERRRPPWLQRSGVRVLCPIHDQRRAVPAVAVPQAASTTVFTTVRAAWSGRARQDGPCRTARSPL